MKAAGRGFWTSDASAGIEATRREGLIVLRHSATKPEPMMSFLPDLPQVIALLLTFLLAGFVKGVTGMGLPTVAMGLLGALISPLAAAGLLIVPSFVTNIWQLVAGPKLGNLLARLWPMMAGIVIGTLSGAAALTGGGTATSAAALGAALMLYAAFTLIARPFQIPRRAERWLSPLVGLATGLVTGATGVFVIPAVPYLQSLGLGRDDLVQALGLSFTVSTIALALGIASHGGWQEGALPLSALLVLPALLGMWLGGRARLRISPAAFRKGFLICLFLLGAQMASRALI